MSTTHLPIINWAGNVVFGAVRLHRPNSIDELQKIVGDSTGIRALGNGHSFSLIADTTNDLVRLDRLPRTLDIDRTRSTVTVAAGMSYADIAMALHRDGFALANLASLPHIFVAGSIAT